ncbi:hypothetical protein OKW21_003305 [Catalinimonas alkaloidigena]|nr:hypothetical protein [Catalinimonas alkaloidigena]
MIENVVYNFILYVTNYKHFFAIIRIFLLLLG